LLSLSPKQPPQKHWQALSKANNTKLKQGQEAKIKFVPTLLSNFPYSPSRSEKGDPTTADAVPCLALLEKMFREGGNLKATHMLYHFGKTGSSQTSL